MWLILRAAYIHETTVYSKTILLLIYLVLHSLVGGVCLVFMSKIETILKERRQIFVIEKQLCMF